MSLPGRKVFLTLRNRGTEKGKKNATSKENLKGENALEWRDGKCNNEKKAQSSLGSGE